MTTAQAASRKQAFADHVAELMEAGFGGVRIKPMFGGFGIYRHDLMFALIADERLYFKADDESRPRFEARGLPPFTFEFKGKVGHLRYHEAPAEVYDEPAHMAEWARLGYDSAVRQQAKKAAGGAKKKAAGKSRTGKGAGGRHPAGNGTTGAADAAIEGGGRLDKSRTDAPALSDLRNLGLKSQEMLAQAGIKTVAQLRKLGAVRAYARTKAACPQASLNLLWALEGALTDRDWKAVAESERASLLMALEDALGGV